MHRTASRRGVTLIDTIVGIALMITVFVGITGVFILSVDVVSNDKARIGALALANEEMEYMRSLSYAAVGTVGGIPAGNVPQDETVSLNDIDYTRHVLVAYEDLPQDGTGANDANHITADVKEAKVSVSWVTKGVTRTLTLATIFAPPGIESDVPGGTIAISVTNAASAPLAGASVRIVNASTTPAIDVTTTSDASGTVAFIGAPAASGYRVTVTEPGYSTAQTYSATATLTSPTPGNLTVADGKTTSATFSIDALGTFAISTWKQAHAADWHDDFSDMTQVATSTGVSLAPGGIVLADGAHAGSLQSVPIDPAHLSAWKSASWNDATTSGDTIRYHVYAGDALVPDSALAGNAAGFTAPPLDLSMLATSTYPSLALAADLTGDAASGTPTLSSWQVAYEEGPEPLPDIPFAIEGTKTIGSDATGNPVYKYDTASTTGGAGSITLPSMEWDTYALSVPASSGYDIAASCAPQPDTLLPGEDLGAALYLAAHTANSLLVDVRGTNGTLIAGAEVALTRGAFSATSTSGACGQSFFPGLSAGTAAGGNAYSIAVDAAGYQPYATADVDVSGTSRLSIVMTQ